MSKNTRTHLFGAKKLCLCKLLFSVLLLLAFMKQQSVSLMNIRYKIKPCIQFKTISLPEKILSPILPRRQERPSQLPD